MKMTEDHRIWSMLVLLLLLSPLALAQGKPPEPGPSKAGSVATRASEGMTKDQADALLAELKQIRQLLEKQQLQLVAAMAPKPAAEPAPPEKVQMRVDNGWYAIGRLTLQSHSSNLRTCSVPSAKPSIQTPMRH
jgi:hypothetical protein